MTVTLRGACTFLCGPYSHNLCFASTTMESFIYAKGNDGYLVTIRQDFAEMTKVDLERQVSKYIRLEAPVDHIRSSVKKLVNQGYKLCNQLDLGWESFIKS